MSDAHVSHKIAKGSPAESIPFQSRVAIEGVSPEIDAGKFPIKRVVGEAVTVTADIHVDGHNELAALLMFKHLSDKDWSQVPMTLIGKGQDRYRATFHPDKLGYYEYTLIAWIDSFTNWRRDTGKKLAAKQEVDTEIREGALLLEGALKNAEQAGGKIKDELVHYHQRLAKGSSSANDLPALFADKRLEELMFRFAPRGRVAEYDRTLQVMVEPVYALYGSWYELFPRSCGPSADVHGTFKDVIGKLQYIASMGFDVLYMPPIHPIGTTARKGPNNTLTPGPNDPGSPWAIGAKEGGHKDLHPQLGSMADFEQLVKSAREHNIKLALDIAYQCSPDHPYVKQHPEWFYHRPDGTIKYAENPPKKYQDIYPIDFESSDWQSLWNELTDVIRFWVSKGVHIFRVDNPHTKPYPFWRYLIEQVKLQHPEVIFLAEAFAPPKRMKHLAKVGFSQSYTYFTWRVSKHEITEYLTELTKTDTVEYFRPNFFANTPDILPEHLQWGGRNMHALRVTLAATLSGTYGIYGPVYELSVADPLPGSEEYKDSEKFQIRHWNLDSPNSLRDYIGRLNGIRAKHAALQNNRSLRFLNISNEQMIAYTKTDDTTGDTIVVVVNLDPFSTQTGQLTLPLQELGMGESYQVHDLITNRRYMWSGDTNTVSLDPNISPAYIFEIRKRVRREQDFDYFS